MAIKRLTPTKKNKVDIYLSDTGEDKVYFERFHGKDNQLIDLHIDTKTQTVVHSLSLKQYDLLKKAISDFDEK